MNIQKLAESYDVQKDQIIYELLNSGWDCVHGYSVTWHEQPGGSSTVGATGFRTLDESYASMKKNLDASGYTLPKWWQWWRWSEHTPGCFLDNKPQQSQDTKSETAAHIGDD